MATASRPPQAPILYLDRSDFRPDRIEELKEGIRGLVAVIERKEPQLIDYGFHLDADTAQMTVTAIHPDSASLELHMEVGREGFRRLGEMLTLREIEVYGAISDSARRLLDQKAQMLGGAGLTVHEKFAGFSRVLT